MVFGILKCNDFEKNGTLLHCPIINISVVRVMCLCASTAPSPCLSLFSNPMPQNFTDTLDILGNELVLHYTCTDSSIFLNKVQLRV